MSVEIKNFRDLEVWKMGKKIAIDIYMITKNFPKDELYGLASQLRRAGVSVPSNIAEGYNRHHTNEYKQFLHVALGSCAEIETQLEIAHELQYLNATGLGMMLEKLDHESRMLRSLIKKL